MTKFAQSSQHSLECDCSYCFDVEPEKSVSRELERLIESLTRYSVAHLEEKHQEEIHKIAGKILLLRRYFPKMELPSKHQLLVDDLSKR